MGKGRVCVVLKAHPRVLNAGSFEEIFFLS
jgi:hypothetical protein